jgi:8-oxo-dGTP diphosphatase
VGLLEPFNPRRILSSPFVRCVQTVQPLADALGLKVEEVEELAEGHGAQAVSLLAQLLERRRSVVACTHGDVVLEALRSLAGDAPPDPPAAKGSVWVLERPKGAKVVTARYLPPPP